MMTMLLLNAVSFTQIYWSFCFLGSEQLVTVGPNSLKVSLKDFLFHDPTRTSGLLAGWALERADHLVCDVDVDHGKVHDTCHVGNDV